MITVRKSLELEILYSLRGDFFLAMTIDICPYGAYLGESQLLYCTNSAPELLYQSKELEELAIRWTF